MEIIEIECRCRDCIYYDNSGKGKAFCHYWTCEPYETYAEVEENAFCSNGKKQS